MISINYKGNRIEWKNRLDELSIQEFDEINNIVFNQERTEIENYIYLINYFTSIPNEEIEEWNYNEFELLCNNMFKDLPEDITTIKEFEYDDKIYKVKDLSKLSIRDIHNIEKIYKLDNINKSSLLLSYIFNAPINYFDDKHLVDYLEYILLLSKTITEHYQKLLSNEIKTINRNNPIK